jgi:tRNA pseudouridine55 synthase
MHGLLLVDKPKAISSFGVVAKIRSLIKLETGQKIKVGHSGTLDPEATGLLVLAIGPYTKRLPELIKQDKTYEVTMCLGQTSSTGDKEGEITEVSNFRPSREMINSILGQFTGDILQTPPAFSAIKINGRRAYQLARKGQTVKLEPRPVKILKSELISYKYPLVVFKTEVSSGTYIRSLAQDMGQKLGTGAYVSDLRRTKIGHFDVAKSIKPEDITYTNLCQRLFTLEK